MAHKATTKNPDECRQKFEEFASLLDIYASDQEAMARRNLSGRHSKDCMIRAEVYRGIAQEMREIEWSNEPEIKDNEVK